MWPSLSTFLRKFSLRKFSLFLVSNNLFLTLRLFVGTGALVNVIDLVIENVSGWMRGGDPKHTLKYKRESAIFFVLYVKYHL